MLVADSLPDITRATPGKHAIVGYAHSVSAETRHKVSAPRSATAVESFVSYGLVSATVETDKKCFGRPLIHRHTIFMFMCWHLTASMKGMVSFLT